MYVVSYNLYSPQRNKCGRKTISPFYTFQRKSRATLSTYIQTMPSRRNMSLTTQGSTIKTSLSSCQTRFVTRTSYTNMNSKTTLCVYNIYAVDSLWALLFVLTTAVSLDVRALIPANRYIISLTPQKALSSDSQTKGAWHDTQTRTAGFCNIQFKSRTDESCALLMHVDCTSPQSVTGSHVLFTLGNVPLFTIKTMKVLFNRQQPLR